MAISHNLISKAKLSERPIAPLVLVGAGISFALATGLLLMGIGLTAAVLVPLAVGVVLLALWSPYWGLVVTLAQFAFLPSEGELFGHFVPNVLQLLAPIVLGAGLLQALKNAYHERLAPRFADFLVAGFGVWGLVGTFISPYGGNWKWYGNRMLFPMMLYFAVRLLRLDRKQVRTLILVLLAAIALQSILMFRESMAGSSPLYEVGSGLIQGVKPAKGPFPFMWNAATYLALWPSLFVYAIATTRGKHLSGALALPVCICNSYNSWQATKGPVGRRVVGSVGCLHAHYGKRRPSSQPDRNRILFAFRQTQADRSDCHAGTRGRLCTVVNGTSRQRSA